VQLLLRKRKEKTRKKILGVQQNISLKEEISYEET
jgi:hypothetical protein